VDVSWRYPLCPDLEVKAHLVLLHAGQRSSRGFSHAGFTATVESQAEPTLSNRELPAGTPPRAAMEDLVWESTGERPALVELVRCDLLHISTWSDRYELTWQARLGWKHPLNPFVTQEMTANLTYTEKGWAAAPGHIAVPTVAPEHQGAIRSMLTQDHDSLREARKAVRAVNDMNGLQLASLSLVEVEFTACKAAPHSEDRLVLVWRVKCAWQSSLSPHLTFSADLGITWSAVGWRAAYIETNPPQMSPQHAETLLDNEIHAGAGSLVRRALKRALLAFNGVDNDIRAIQEATQCKATVDLGIQPEQCSFVGLGEWIDGCEPRLLYEMQLSCDDLRPWEKVAGARGRVLVLASVQCTVTDVEPYQDWAVVVQEQEPVTKGVPRLQRPPSSRESIKWRNMKMMHKPRNLNQLLTDG